MNRQYKIHGYVNIKEDLYREEFVVHTASNAEHLRWEPIYRRNHPCGPIVCNSGVGLKMEKTNKKKEERKSSITFELYTPISIDGIQSSSTVFVIKACTSLIRLIELGFYVPPDTKQVILETFTYTKQTCFVVCSTLAVRLGSLQSCFQQSLIDHIKSTYGLLVTAMSWSPRTRTNGSSTPLARPVDGRKCPRVLIRPSDRRQLTSSQLVLCRTAANCSIFHREFGHWADSRASSVIWLQRSP